MAGALEKSSEVMKYMQQLVKVPEIQATMQELSKEMMKVCALRSMYISVLNYYTYHDCDGLWISDLKWHRILQSYFSIFSLILVSIEKIYQTLKTVFDQISKHLEVCKKCDLPHIVVFQLSSQCLEMGSNTVFV